MQKPLRIVQAVHAFPPAIGGIETHAFQLSSALSSLGQKLIIHTTHFKNSKLSDNGLKQKGIKVKRHFSFSFPGFSSVKFIPFLCFHLLFERANIYHSHGFGSPIPIITSIISFIKRKKFFWTIHGMPKFSGIKQLFVIFYSFFALIPYFLSRKIICVSENAKKSLPKKFQKKAIVIPNGISAQFLSHSPSKTIPSAPGKFAAHPPSRGAEKGKFVILYVGRLDSSKGIWVLANAFSEFYKKHPNTILKFVGPDEGNRKKLQQFARKRSLPIQFSTEPPENMPSLYSSSSVCVLPSFYEGFGLSVFESWACSTPAISTPVGAIPEFFSSAFKKEYKKFLFSGINSLLHRLEFIYSLDSRILSAYTSKAKKALSSYQWPIIAKKTLETYRS
ncbi:MAG: glycosyltransferase family 4 protein [Candidatus Micrarchaeota archaeon]